MSVTTSVASLLSGSWQWWHNREAVTLSVSGELVPVTHSLQDVKRFDVNQRDVPPQKTGGFTSFDLIWIIPKAKLPVGVIPKVADAIVPAEGGEYVILDVMQNGWKTWYKVTARNLVLALGLHDTIAFRRPTYTNAGGTKSISSYTTLYSGVGAKIVAVGDDYQPDLLGKRQTRERYEVHSGRWVHWEPGDQIRDQKGSVFQIVSSTQNTLDNLSLYQCERVN